MAFFVLLGFVVTATLFIKLVLWILPPTHPKGVPAVPFYVTFLPFFKDIDQAETYRKYLERPLQEFGAVKIFFGGRWNILVQRPSYVAEMFKNEDIYAKSGNQVKIPYSVLAEYTGDNIISSHGENWKLYQGIIKPGLQRSFPEGPILGNARILCNMISKNQGKSGHGGIMVPELLQRYSLANLSQVILSTDFKTLEDENAPLSKMQVAVKREIFNPIFLNFPFLDRFPIPSRTRARRMVKEFTDQLTQNITKSHANQECSMGSEMLSQRLIAAKENGIITEQQFRHNCVSVFLAGHENPQLLLVSMMYLLAKNQWKKIQESLRFEILSIDAQGLSENLATGLPLLTSVCYETLRLYPPISQLINRRTSSQVVLGNKVVIPAGTYVGYNAYSTGRDPNAWGPSADEFDPLRWGSNMEEIAKRYRKANARAEFIAFHGGRRACLGQKFAMLEAKITMVEITKSFRWTLDPTWDERMTPAGPLYPRALRLIFHPIAQEAEIVE